jgi:hypothetical protein
MRFCLRNKRGGGGDIYTILSLLEDYSWHIVYRSQIHERTIWLRFLGIILKGLRLEVSLYNVYITNQFQTNFARGGGGGGVKPLVEVAVHRENSIDFCPNYVQEFGLSLRALHGGEGGGGFMHIWSI